MARRVTNLSHNRGSVTDFFQGEMAQIAQERTSCGIQLGLEKLMEGGGVGSIKPRYACMEGGIC